MPKTALVVGSTGLVGGILSQLLISGDEFEKVILVTRNTIEGSIPQKVQVLVVDFDNLPAGQIKADIVFCCLGTTIKTAGSKDAFHKVDCIYPYEIAKLALQNGAKSYFLVSAMGADKKSVFFYNRVKGEVEEKIDSLGYETFNIFRPSLLVGKRKETRLGEKIGTAFANLFNILIPNNYRGIKAEKVAIAMFNAALKEQKGKKIFLSGEMQN